MIFVVNFLIRETQVHLVAGEYQASRGFPEKMDWMESRGWTEMMGNLEPLEQEVTTLMKKQLLSSGRSYDLHDCFSYLSKLYIKFSP